MGQRHLPRKSICIPASPPVDVSRYIPVIDHVCFQRLRDRKQLGVNYLVFPGAVHSRFEHVLGVLGLTQRVCQLHEIRGDDRHALCGLALLHDVGHGPFSHQIEPILPGNHKTRGSEVAETMAPALRECGLDPERIGRLLNGEDPLSQLVADRNLGTDKLDYLRRDALHIGFTGMPDTEKLLSFTLIEDGVLAIEEKFTEDIKRVQKFYSYLHQHGYLNKTALSMQRIFQRAVQEQLAVSSVDAASLWDMTDAGLYTWLQQERSSLTGQFIDRLESRQFHRTGLVLKPPGYGFVERRSRKGIQVREWPAEDLRQFTEQYADCWSLRQLEDALALFLGLDQGDVLFAAMPFFDKLVPKDVRIFSGASGGSFWLFEKDRDHLQSLTGDYSRTFAIRVIVVPEHRDRVLDAADRVADFIHERLA